MNERNRWCKIAQQPCGVEEGVGDGNQNCGECSQAELFLKDIYKVLESGGATNFWTKDNGDMLIAGYTSSRQKEITMRIQKGDTVG